MPITIHADMALKTSQNFVGSITEYSTETLVLLLPQEVIGEALTFSWISPTNLRFAERQLFRDSERDIVDGDTTSEYAYSATIYPVMTAGIQAQQTSGKSIFAFRKGNVFSPIIRVNVDKSIMPEQSEILPTVTDELQIQINALIARIEALENQ